MKISFLSGMGQGGAERQVIETAKLLSSNNHIVKIYTYGFSNLFYDTKDIQLINIKSNNKVLPSKLNKIISVIKLLIFITKDKPDYMISYITKLNVILGLVGNLNHGKNKIKFIGSERNSELRYVRSNSWRFICSICYKGLDGIYCNNKEAMNHLKKVKYDESKVYYLPNLINTDYFLKEEFIKDSIEKHHTVVIPARVIEQKNQKVLINIAEMLKSANIKIKFILAGNNEGIYAKELIETINKKKLEQYFTIMGQVKNIKKLYNESTLVFLPSLYEGLPNSIIEAMSCECIVLGSNIPSISEIISDGENGFLVNINNDKEIFTKLIALINLSDDKKINVQKRAREKAVSFGKESYYTKILHILDQMK
jgi:glycosyltransferase involved in cell wall biosynthesis